MRLDDERDEDERAERQQRHPADRVHRRRRAAERPANQVGAGRGQVAPRVEAEARARAAQPRREELRKVKAPPMPRLATKRRRVSVHTSGASAQAAVAPAYVSMVTSSVRERPSRSVTKPNRTPPVAQPTSRLAVMAPVAAVTRAAPPGSPGTTPSRLGTHTGATKLKSSPSKTSKPQPSQAAKKTSHWYRLMPHIHFSLDTARSRGANLSPSFRGRSWPRSSPCMSRMP